MLRRKKIVVKPGFQLRYTGIILAAVFAASLICILTTYYSSMSLLGEKLAYVYPAGRLAVTIREINMIIILRVLISIPLLVLIGIMLSHRVAGPAYRIEKTLKEIGKGNLDIYIKLRKYDELVGIADAVNEMLVGLKERVVLKEALDK